MLTLHSEKDYKLNYIDSGHFSVDGEWIFPKRTGDSYELIYATEGMIFISEDDKEYLLQKGDALILHPDKIWEGTQGSFGRTSFFWVKFNITPDDFVFCQDSYSVIENNEVENYFNKLLHFAHSPEENPQATDATLLLLLNEIHNNSLNMTKKPPLVIRDVAEWIRVNSDKRLTVEIVAKLFGYTPDHLSGVFNDCYNMGLKEYINIRKIDHMKDLLLTTNYSIKHIADILGYSNENQFINHFKYHVGLSPTKFRNNFYK